MNDGSTAVPTSAGSLNRGELAVLEFLGTVESATTPIIERELEAKKMPGYLWESLKRLKDRGLIVNVVCQRDRRVGTANIKEDFVNKEMFRITEQGRNVNTERDQKARKIKNNP